MFTSAAKAAFTPALNAGLKPCSTLGLECPKLEGPKLQRFQLECLKLECLKLECLVTGRGE